MNMMQMVGLMVCCYFVTLVLLAIYRNIINVKVGNVVFILVDLVFFFFWNYGGYQRGWLDDGFMTLENISPFIMTLIPLTVFMSERVRSYCNSAIAFLWVGMFIALLISPQHAYIFNYDIEATPIYTGEAACHLIASLYGAYLIITKQVKCDAKHWRRSVVCMFSVIGFGVLLNYVFHMSNFGMDPYGNYTIYMIDIFGSFEATLAAYLLGVLLVLTLGMQIGYVFFKLVESTHQEGAQNGEEVQSSECRVQSGEEVQNGEEVQSSECRVQSEDSAEEKV